MYAPFGQDATVENYLKPHFMDGFIKREDYLFITTGCQQYKKEMAYSGTHSSDENNLDKVYDYGDPLTQWQPPRIEGEIIKNLYANSFLIGRQLKPFVDIITMNASHHTNFDHAYVLNVHFNKSAIESNVTAASAKRQRV